jgi:hypothetical protein
VVTNRGDLDATTYFYYNGRWQLLETRDGSENVDMQIVPGTQYVDEIVLFRKKDFGTVYVYQDANWNVTSTTNLAGAVLDRISTTPYGQPTFDTYTIAGDYDADGDLDGSDDSQLTTCKNGTQPVTGDCRIFDFDNDGDVDTADETRFDQLYPGSGTTITRQPGKTTSANGFVFAHQGLLVDGETRGYQQRTRMYGSQLRRFLRRTTWNVRDASKFYAQGAIVNLLDPSGVADLVHAQSYSKSPPSLLPQFGPIHPPPGPGWRGCGPGEPWSVGDLIVADNPFGCPFVACCQDHDDCYGARIGNEPDTGPLAPRDVCDTQFLECMLGAGWFCDIWAHLYFSAVSVFGGGSYG